MTKERKYYALHLLALLFELNAICFGHRHSFGICIQAFCLFAIKAEGLFGPIIDRTCSEEGIYEATLREAISVQGYK